MERLWNHLEPGLGPISEYDEYKDGRLCKCWECPEEEGVGAKVVRWAPKG